MVFLYWNIFKVNTKKKTENVWGSSEVISMFLLCCAHRPLEFEQRNKEPPGNRTYPNW